MLIDDILSEVMSHLVPSDAARAGRVSIQWHHHSLRPAYSHVILHAVSQPALLLAKTLHDSPPLRALVRHLTVIGCTLPGLWDAMPPYYYEQLFAWLKLLPEDALRTSRVVSYRLSNTHFRMLDIPSTIRPSSDTQIVFLRCPCDVHEPERVTIHDRCHAYQHIAPSASPTFVASFLSAFDTFWQTSGEWQLQYVTSIGGRTAGGRALATARALLPLLAEKQLSDTERVSLIIGNTTEDMLGQLTTAEEVELIEGGQQEQKCICEPLPESFVRYPTARMVAILLLGGGEPFPVSTIEKALDIMQESAPDHSWAKLRVQRSGPNSRLLCEFCPTCRVAFRVLHSWPADKDQSNL
ncbi:hypothetical protein C8Q76DRAFT_426794 [Earliella scabrosa]|nr:hypothetical protein C8Q76DRAFT_426794 [Earliella scabrosa]